MTRCVEIHSGRPRRRMSSQKERMMRRRREIAWDDSEGSVFRFEVSAETAVVGGISCALDSEGLVSRGAVLIVASCALSLEVFSIGAWPAFAVSDIGLAIASYITGRCRPQLAKLTMKL